MGQLNNEDWEHVDIAALIAGINMDGVISGLAVSESAIPAMTVLVASGSCSINNVVYTEGSGQNLTIANGDATNPRKDIVVYDASAANPAIVVGIPSTAPVPPDIPPGDIYLAMVHVAANESTSITNIDIDEGRVYVRSTAEIRSQINVEDGATRDQCQAEIRDAVEAAQDSNTFTDADHTKLNSVDTNADVTGSNTPQNHASRHEPNGADDIDGLGATLVASSTLIFQNDNVRTSTNYTPVSEVKAIIGTMFSGTVRVSWQQHGTSGYISYGQMFIGGVAYSARQETSSTSYTTYTFDGDIKPGDKIEIRGATSNPSYPAYFRYLRIYGTKSALTIRSNDP